MTQHGADIRDAIWHQLEVAVENHSHGWRTPVLANVDADGIPQARTVVLRRVDRQARRLFFYTDHRSPKAKQLRSQNRACFVFWCQQLRWQLRAQTTVQIESDGLLVQGAWNSISATAAAFDYLSLEAPGSPMELIREGQADKHALGIIVAKVHELDWLELNAQGHRRARVSDADCQWLVP